jgi:hypothetical protein
MVQNVVRVRLSIHHYVNNVWREMGESANNTLYLSIMLQHVKIMYYLFSVYMQHFFKNKNCVFYYITCSKTHRFFI